MPSWRRQVNLCLYCLGVTGSDVTCSNATKFIRILHTICNWGCRHCSYASVFAEVSTNLYTYIYDIRTSRVGMKKSRALRRTEQLNFLRWRPILVCPHYGNCFLTLPARRIWRWLLDVWKVLYSTGSDWNLSGKFFVQFRLLRCLPDFWKSYHNFTRNGNHS